MNAERCDLTLGNVRKHEVVTGTISSGRLESSHWAGEALYHEGDDYFQLRLSIFPLFSYYIARNKDVENLYTVWSQKVKDSAPVLFRRPVGKAYIDDDLKTHLKVEIPLLNLGCSPLICLFPAP